MSWRVEILNETVAPALCRGDGQQIPRAALGGLMRHSPTVGDAIVQNLYTGAPRPMKMGNIPSPWRYDAAASHARAPLKHPIAYDLALRPRAAIFQCHGRLGWALIHPRNRVQVGCRRKPRGQISAPSRLLLTQIGSRALLSVCLDN